MATDHPAVPASVAGNHTREFAGVPDDALTGDLTDAVNAAVDQPPVAPIGGERTDPRFLNIRGRLIQTHRALLHFNFTAGRLLSMVLVPAVFTLLTFALWPEIDQFWSAAINFWSSLLGPAISLSHQPTVIPWIGSIPFPLVDAALPSVAQWWYGLIISLVLLIGPAFMPPRMLPAVYALRFIAMLQLAAQFYFFFWGNSFPHRASTSVASMMQSTVGLMLIAPWLYGFIYNVFGFRLWRKVALTAMALVYLIVLAPVQFTLAAVLMAAFSLLWHPLIYLLGTTLLQLIMLLALYAWAMSWDRPGLERG